MPCVQRFNINDRGRDFVVGDVHGCFDQLEAALTEWNVDPAEDRIFCVGDLIDRGPRSEEALGWMQIPWFHVCRGNHEHMLLNADDPEELLVWMINGGAWWQQQDDVTRAQFRTAVAKLPLAMEIETPRGRVGIVHADIPAGMDWDRFTRALEEPDPRTRYAAIWGRSRAEGYVTTPVAGIDQVVCGHTITSDKQIHQVGNVWFIDTGAFLDWEGGHLTMLPLDRLFED